MSASPSASVHRLFYHPAYWCHSCDMSIGLPPSPTPHALLCPHCHRDSLEQMEMEMEMEEYIPPPSPTPPSDHLSSAAFTPTDDNILLTSPYLRRLVHHLTTAASEADPRSDPASRSSIDSLQEVVITPDSDPTALCPVCKDPFAVGSLTKMMPCKHAYHPDCIVPWLEINNSCPVCRFKLPALDEGKTKESGREEESVGPAGLEELVDDEGDLLMIRTLRYISRRNRWNEDSQDVRSPSERNLFSPTQIGEVERGDGVSERQNSVETFSRWQEEERGGGAGGDEEGSSFGRSS